MFAATVATLGASGMPSDVILTVNITQGGLSILGIAAVFFLLFILFIRIMRRASKKHKVAASAKKKQHKKEDMHLHMKELKEAMIAEMRGTSKQNWIMIALTIVFITVSIFNRQALIFFTNLFSSLAGK